MAETGCTNVSTANPWAIAASPDGEFIYVTHLAQYGSISSTGTLSVFRANPLTFLSTIEVGRNPWNLAFNRTSTRAYVPNQSSASVSVIDVATQSVIDTIAVGNSPVSVAVHPNGERAYVTNANTSTISVIDTSTNTVVASPTVGSNPIGISIDPTGSRLYVVNSTSNDVSVLSTATNTVIATVPVGSNPYGEGQFIGGGKLLDIDGDGAVFATTDMLLLMRWQLGIRGEGLISGIGTPSGALRTTTEAIETYLRELESLGAAR